MIARLVDAALANRIVVLMLVGLLVAMGLYDLRRLPIDAQPDISPRQVLVITQASGLGPLEVERFITFPVELALQGLPRMENLRSVSRYGLSVVYVRFSDEMDIYAARNLVFSRLPRGAGAARIGHAADGAGLDRARRDLPVRGARRRPHA